MFRRATKRMRRGDRFEFWAKAKGESASHKALPFSIKSERGTAFRIAALPPYFEFFAHTHYADEDVFLEWDDDAVEFSLFYCFNMGTVADEGVTFLEWGKGEITELPSASLPRWYESDRSRPQLRFSPFKNWMNDPNGLCFVGGRYHLFYQFHPNGTDWGPMHWGHAVSPDLYRWTHLPVFLHPQRNLAALGATGGAFSGNAFIDPAGELSFYYTERLPAYDLFKGYKEVQKRAVPAADLLAPTENRLVLEYGPLGSAHDFRDPKVWYDSKTAAYRMILGAAIDGNPAVLLYTSKDALSWTYVSVLYQAPDRFREHGARCVECPDFFEIDGHWVLVMGFVGFTEPETGRHNLLYAAVGSFQDDAFVPYRAELQELDFGTDYYAMQSFDAGGRQLALAWVFNWEFRKPAGSIYSGEMSLPRLLGLNEARQLTMVPEAGIKSLRQKRIDRPGEMRVVPSATEPSEISLAGSLEGVEIIARTSTGKEAHIAHVGGRLVVRTPEDDGSISYRSSPISLRQLTVFLDRGVIEIFANHGAVCGTRRSYDLDTIVEIQILPAPATQIADIEAWSYQSAWDRTQAKEQ